MNRTLRTLSLVCLAAATAACAASTRGPSAERPRATDAPNFVAVAATDARRTAALASWKTIVGEQTAAASTTPELRPVTATISALPSGLDAPPRMPLVVISDAKTQTEEETRESLRRFIQTAAPLLGVEPKELSLVSVMNATDTQNGARTARYRQNAFQYPLRNGYGEVSITFTQDLRVLALSSTAVPDAERLRRSLATVAQGLPVFDASALVNRAVTYTDRGGAQRTRTLGPADALKARQLVVYPVRRDADPSTLELHVAWEAAPGGESTFFVYVDAVTGEVLGAAEGSPETAPQTPTPTPSKERGQ
jgi:hypothetical protein